MKNILWLIFATNLYAQSPGFLEAEWIEGPFRFCTYDNGAIISIPKNNLCPQVIDLGGEEYDE